MIRQSALFVSLFLLSVYQSEASMNGQDISGEILDNRITNCGVRIEGEGMAIFRPFIETSEDLSGTVEVVLTKTSASGSSTIRQANGFRGGTLGDIRLAVDRPSSVVLRIAVADAAGADLCRIDTRLELGANDKGI